MSKDIVEKIKEKINSREISIKPNKEKVKLFNNLSKNLEKYETPNWLLLDAKELKGKIVSIPTLEDIKTQFNPTLIVEFYLF